jgi:hypothetical protein
MNGATLGIHIQDVEIKYRMRLFQKGENLTNLEQIGS